jgi:hypothetical protein
MTRPAVQPRDTERLVVDYLTVALTDVNCTVGIGVPEAWTPSSTPHVEVALDGLADQWPVVTQGTVRVVARAGSTTAAKALCAVAFGWLCAHEGDGVIVSARPLTGPIPATDPDTHAELAAATVRVTVRTARLEEV